MKKRKTNLLLWGLVVGTIVSCSLNRTIQEMYLYPLNFSRIEIMLVL